MEKLKKTKVGKPVKDEAEGTNSPKHNVKFVAGRFGLKPFTQVVLPSGVYEMPEHSDEPFYFEAADELVRLFPQYYKEVK